MIPACGRPSSSLAHTADPGTTSHWPSECPDRQPANATPTRQAPEDTSRLRKAAGMGLARYVVDAVLLEGRSAREVAAAHGIGKSLLSDNGAVFTASPRHGKVLLQSELERLGIASKNSRPYHPQTCGKIERLHQTLKRATSPSSHPRTASQSCKTSSTRSSTTTTTSAPTERSTDTPRYRPTAPASRPNQPTAPPTHPPTSGCAKTSRPDRQGQRALPQQALQNRPRKSPQRPHNQAPKLSTISRDTRPACAETQQSGEDRTLRKPRGRAGADAELEVEDRLGRNACGYRASCVARSSCSIALRRSRLRSAFFADDSLCGLHSRQPARRCLGRPRL
jgi:transposase InsO family protein